MAFLWLSGDGTVREAFPSFHPFTCIVVPALLIFPILFKVLFGHVGVYAWLLWLPHFCLIAYADNPVTAPVLQFETGDGTGSSVGAVLLSLAIVTTTLAVYFFPRLLGRERQATTYALGGALGLASEERPVSEQAETLQSAEHPSRTVDELPTSRADGLEMHPVGAQAEAQIEVSK